MKVTLSSRLQRIADYVPAGSTVIDVGTDHAYIPIYLLQNGLSGKAYASDVKSGPLQNAARDAEKAGVAENLSLTLCDGLALCDPETVDTVIIAGMGGETIMGILAAAPWTKGKRLILQPQTRFSELRAFLRENGYRIADASLVYDTGRIYTVWLVTAGEMAPCGAIDPVLVEKRDPLLKPYTEDLIKRRRKQIQGMEASKTADPAALAGLKAELEELLKIHKEAEQWQR